MELEENREWIEELANLRKVAGTRWERSRGATRAELETIIDHAHDRGAQVPAQLAAIYKDSASGFAIAGAPILFDPQIQPFERLGDGPVFVYGYGGRVALFGRLGWWAILPPTDDEPPAEVFTMRMREALAAYFRALAAEFANPGQGAEEPARELGIALPGTRTKEQHKQAFQAEAAESPRTTRIRIDPRDIPRPKAKRMAASGGSEIEL